MLVSRKDKLKRKLLRKPKDFTYDELVSLLSYFEYYEFKKGKTDGSRRALESSLNCTEMPLLNPWNSECH